MKLENVGIVIATRELTLDEKQKVTVLIGKPEPFPDGIDWYCPYQINGIGTGRVGLAGGVDPAQALVLALQNVGAMLVCSSEFEAGRLSWECGAVKGDLGFPLPKSLSDLAPQIKRPPHENGDGPEQDT